MYILQPSTGHIYYILHRNAIKSENDFFFFEKLLAFGFEFDSNLCGNTQFPGPKVPFWDRISENNKKCDFDLFLLFVCDLDCVISTTIDHTIWLHPKHELMLRCIKIIEFFMSEHTVRAQNGGLSFPLAFFLLRIDANIVCDHARALQSLKVYMKKLSIGKT